MNGTSFSIVNNGPAGNGNALNSLLMAQGYTPIAPTQVQALLNNTTANTAPNTAGSQAPAGNNGGTGWNTTEILIVAVVAVTILVSAVIFLTRK